MAHDVRRAQISDIPAIVELIYGLAEYERLSDECGVSAAQMEIALFGNSPKVFAHVAEEDGKVVGIAVWYLSFSTWDGVHGIFLEDLFVQPDNRGAGHGARLMRALGRECVDNGYSRLAWSVLDWNEPSIAFYKSFGAAADDGWTSYRLTGNALKSLAASKPVSRQ